MIPMTNTAPAAILPLPAMQAAAAKGSRLSATVAEYQRGRRIARRDLVLWAAADVRG